MDAAFAPASAGKRGREHIPQLINDSAVKRARGDGMPQPAAASPALNLAGGRLGKDELPIIAAAWAGDVAEVELLLAAGADMYSLSAKGTNILALAAARGHVSLLSRLLPSPVLVNHANEKGWTALMVAAEQGHARACELLLQHGAHVYALNGRGESPLVLACMYKHSDVAALLIPRMTKAMVRVVPYAGYPPSCTQAAMVCLTPARN